MTVSTPSPTATDPAWTKPGPGSWTLDLDHTGPTPSRAVRDLLAEGAEVGLAQAADLLGAPFATMHVRFVNGRFYRRMVPVVAGGRDVPPPPAPALWLGARIMPALRARERAARAALDGRIWLDELQTWEAEWKPTIEARNTEFATVDPSGLDNRALADHIEALWEHLRWTTTLHFRLHGTDVGPIGLLLARTDELGIERDAVFAALAGASPATNAPAVAFASVAQQVAEVAGGTDVHSLDEVRALSPEIGAALDRLITRFGWRLTTGYDLIDRTLVELPGVILRSVSRPSAEAPGASAQADAEDRGERASRALVERVPASRRDEIAVALADARRCYGLRDENGPLTYEWPAGILRRAFLETGRRLVASEAVESGEHVFDATVDELLSLLREDPGPLAAELAERHATRSSWAHLDAPEVLGPPEQIPPLWALPRGMRMLTSATLAVMDLLGTERTEARSEQLRGLGIGSDRYVGTARVVLDAAEAYERVEPGDVLVTAATAPTFNAVLALAGAVVVEEGGQLSHAAVIARELGFPAVIGAEGATSGIPDGSTVEVDPIDGRVRVLS